MDAETVQTGVGLIERLRVSLALIGQALMSGSLPVTIASDQTDTTSRENRQVEEMLLVEALNARTQRQSTRAADHIAMLDNRGSAGRGSLR
jgi:hypothetical protein